MRDFVQRLLVFIVALTLLLVTIPTSDIGDSYLTAYRTHITPKEIQFIGGSNLCFGLKSEVLNKHIVDNYSSYGFHGATGLDFHLQQLEIFDNRTIIFSPPLEWIDNTTNPHLRAEVLSFFPFSLKSLTPLKLATDAARARTINAIRLIRKRKTDRVKPQKEEPTRFEWSNAVLDENGLIYNGLRPDHLVTPKKLHIPSNIDKRSWKKGASAIQYILPPPIAESNREDAQQLESIFEELNVFLESKLLLSVSNCVLPDSLFGDDQYHLNERGADRYSELVGQALRHQETLLPK